MNTRFGEYIFYKNINLRGCYTPVIKSTGYNKEPIGLTSQKKKNTN